MRRQKLIDSGGARAKATVGEAAAMVKKDQSGQNVTTIVG
jgi:hypothetical protein